MEIILRTKLLISLVVFALFSLALGQLDISWANVSYSELVQMNAHCYPLDTCQQPRDSNQLDKYNCDCDSSCVMFDSCCIDSPYRTALATDLKCRKVYKGSHVYMVDSCRNPDLVPETLCGSDAEERNDLFLVIPVTSLSTGITYKNYFCAVCNENTETDQLILWNLQVRGRFVRLIADNIMPNFKYDTYSKSWRIVGESIVNIAIVMPNDLEYIVRTCSEELISNCAKEWKDVSVVKKCAAYMAKIAIVESSQVFWFRNPHCALCNFKKVEKSKCNNLEVLKSFLPNKHKQIRNNTQRNSYHPMSYDVSSIPFLKIFQLHDKPKCGSRMIYDKLGKKCRCNSQHSLFEARSVC
ncbi:uncharacterized protein NPIL_302711 [Nephila pilipes]|uniref:SMB domain-containing protein n=1 Tax=Nephila pilipes TaxID=299642 RepID=A0A8X6TDA8_NEPPI|nr:uncharacterized protein NPIL_302711 [Nephila pilipes]